MFFTFSICLAVFICNTSFVYSIYSQYTYSAKDDVQRPVFFDSYYKLSIQEDYPEVCYEYSNEICAQLWLEAANEVAIRNENRLANVYYRYSTNITKGNLKLASEFQKQSTNLLANLQSKAKRFKWQTFQSPRIKRMFEKIVSTIKSHNEATSQRLVDVKDRIDFIYNNARPCFGKCLSAGERSMIDLFQQERDYDKLAGFWTAWRNVTGAKIRNSFIEMVKLENMGARENGYHDAAHFKLLADFEESDFKETAKKLFENTIPLYKELHAYVRHCLSRYYPWRFDKNGSMPSHIFGNIWAEQWTNIFPIIKKCMKHSVSIDFLEEVNQRLGMSSVKNMFTIAERFYESIGMYNMTKDFWERSMFEKPKDRIVDCHPSSIDFANGKDYRMIMCTRKNLNDLTFIHHEMGHIQYFMAYRGLPFVFRGSANAGLQETIGDSIILSVRAPSHLKKIGLLSDIPLSHDFDIEYLMATALEKVPFIPHAFVMDSYIWDVYNNTVPFSKLNKHWWDLKLKYQGIKPPVKRSENDFDAGSKYHIAFGIPYMRYLFSFIIQYQFYESMCNISGYKGPLHLCDFYQSKEAGRRLLEMLKQGQSKPWREIIKILTGTETIQSTSFVKYYEPLYKWLKARNKLMNIRVGW